MIYLSIGSVIGLVMGLTGAGGALVAIPLFMVFIGASLKEASVLSLVAVILASAINYLSQRAHTNLRAALIMFAAGLISSYVMVPVKAMTSDTVISILLTGISLYSLYAIWASKGSNLAENKIDNIWGLIIAGVVLGSLTTLTGLGGGVLLMPLLVGVFHYSPKNAVATSLLTIALTSTASLFFQIKSGFDFPELIEVAFLTGGILLSVALHKLLVRRIHEAHLVRVQQIVFTSVVIFAVIKFFHGG